MQDPELDVAEQNSKPQTIQFPRRSGAGAIRSVLAGRQVSQTRRERLWRYS